MSSLSSGAAKIAYFKIAPARVRTSIYGIKEENSQGIIILSVHFKFNRMEMVIGIVAGILTSVSMVPQLVKVIREKDVANLSPLMIGVLLAGVALWVVYGLMLKEWPVILSNAFSVLVNMTLLVCYFIFRKRS